MKKWILFLISLLTASYLYAAAGPILPHSDENDSREFQNVYIELKKIGTEVNFSATGSPTYQGTKTNDSACTGCIGEYKYSWVNAVSGSGGASAYSDLTSLTLTAGDWDVQVSATMRNNGSGWSPASNAATGCGSTTHSGNDGTGVTEGLNFVSLQPYAAFGSFSYQNITTPTIQYSVATSSTAYLKIYNGPYTGGPPLYYAVIRARRVR